MASWGSGLALLLAKENIQGTTDNSNFGHRRRTLFDGFDFYVNASLEYSFASPATTTQMSRITDTLKGVSMKIVCNAERCIALG